MKNEAYVSPKGTTQTGNNVMNLDSWISFDGFRMSEEHKRSIEVSLAMGGTPKWMVCNVQSY